MYCTVLFLFLFCRQLYYRTPKLTSALNQMRRPLKCGHDHVLENKGDRMMEDRERKGRKLTRAAIEIHHQLVGGERAEETRRWLKNRT